MVDYQEIFSQISKNDRPKPSSKLLVEALLTAEKSCHKQKIKYQFSQLIGNWRLYFITGTKNSRQKIGKVIGAGFYLPSLVKITINYEQLKQDNLPIPNQGIITNQVQVGLVTFTITGPTKYLPPKNILAFDFNHLTMSILGGKIYQTDVRGGTKSQQDFYQTSIKKQAFFSYFYASKNLIIARGRGGGLALWKKMVLPQ